MHNIIGFYNHYNSGDIFESREFVRDIMEMCPAKEYVYYINQSDRILLDIDKLTVVSGVPENLGMRVPSVSDIENKNVYINTWIGRDSRYVLPGFSCTLEKLYEMYNDILAGLGWSGLSREPIDYLTTIDYSKFDIARIDKYIGRNLGKRMVFVSNGQVHSQQAKNFDMSYLIERLAYAFPDRIFFVTSPVNTPCHNVINANLLTDMTSTSNLNELSYLSTFCDVIIGRNSGPQVFSWTKENCFSDKTNITFSYNSHCKHFVHHTDIKMKRLWSNATCVKKTFDFISKEI